MCYNLPATVTSLVLHVVCSALIWHRGGNYRAVAVVLFGIGSMQLSELFIHMDFDATRRFRSFYNSSVNRFGSLMGRFSLDVFQPVFSLFALLIAPVSVALKTNLSIIWLVLFVTKLVMVLASFPTDSQFVTTAKDERACINASNPDTCLLRWDWDALGNNWTMYVLLVIGIVAFAINQLTFWALFGVFHLVMTYLQQRRRGQVVRIWNSSGSCFWGPLLAYGLVLLDLPRRCPELPGIGQLREWVGRRAWIG